MENLLKKNIYHQEAKKRLKSLNNKFNKLIIIIRKNIILIFELTFKYIFADYIKIIFALFIIIIID